MTGKPLDRSFQVRLAQIDIQKAVVILADQHGLTYAETVTALAATLDGLSKDEIQRARKARRAAKPSSQPKG